jgi:pyruvate dehydrogenase E2 component (dihydrolipoamide acetyltransferase)
MAVEFKLPGLGDGIKSADVVKVLVQVGDVVSAGQTVIEVETEKAGVDVPCPIAGTVTQVRVAAGAKAEIGAVVLVLDETAMADEGVRAPSGEAAPPDAPRPMPSDEAAPPAVPMPSDEAAPPAVPMPSDEAAPPAVPTPSAEAATHPGSRPAVFASPSVRQFAREIGVDIHVVEGSGPGGRISMEDVKLHSRTFGRGPASDEPVVMPELLKWGPVRVEEMTNVRRATAAYMANCWATVPHVTIFDKADVTDLEAWRQALAPRAEKAGVKVTVTAIMLKFLAAALKQFPQLNATIDIGGEQIVYKQHYHLGVAADTERGLVVPVVRDVDKKSLFAIAGELAELAAAGRRGKLAPDAMQGGTFTLTNLGGLGVGHFTPIVPSPQVAILGLGRALREPVWDVAAASFAPRLMMPLSLSFDHRLVDGADGARFLRWLATAVAQPLNLLEA